MLVSVTAKWAAIAKTVQGQQSATSCVLSRGRVFFSARPIPKSAKPNLKFLAEILRSKEPLPPIARAWMADLFDPDSDSEYYVESLIRRSVGAKPAGRTHNWDAAEYALDLMRWGENRGDLKARGETWETWKRSVFLTQKKFNITKSAVESAIKSYRDSLRNSSE